MPSRKKDPSLDQLENKLSQKIDSRIDKSEKLTFTITTNLLRNQTGELKTYVDHKFDEVNEKLDVLLAEQRPGFIKKKKIVN